LGGKEVSIIGKGGGGGRSGDYKVLNLLIGRLRKGSEGI